MDRDDPEALHNIEPEKPGDDAATVEPAPVAEIPPAPELTTLLCPSCEATLQKVAVTPGVKINCLHCGARFFPPNSAGIETGGAGSASDSAPSGGREPKSPGYWLLRVPAVVALVAGLFCTALVVWKNLVKSGSPAHFEWWLGASYVPLFALLGLFAFYVSRALARIDAGLMHRFWELGLLREALPPMPGSSLPYIGPLAIAGGFFPVFLFAFGEQGGGQVFVGALLGAALFLLGFMAEDVRQFAWRQHAAAEKIEKPKWLDIHRPYGTSLYPWTALSCAGAFGGLTLLFSYLAFDLFSSSYQRNQQIVFFCLALTCVAIGITGFMLCCDLDRMATSWVRVAAQVRRPATTQIVLQHTYEPPVRGLSALARWLPLAWLVYGVVWLVLSALSQGSRSFGQQGVWFLLSLSSVALAFWFSRSVLQVARWREAKCEACATLFGEKRSRENLKLAGLPGISVRVTVLLTFIEAALYAYLVIASVLRWRATTLEWQFLSAVPLLLGIIHYPTLWIASVAREILLLEQYALPPLGNDDA